MPSKILTINPAQPNTVLKASQRKEPRPKPPGLLPNPQPTDKDSQKSLLSQQRIVAKYVQNGFQATGLGFGKRRSKPIASCRGGMRGAEGRSESKIESYRQRIARMPIEEFVKAYNSAPPQELDIYQETAQMHIVSARHFGGIDGGGGSQKTQVLIRMAQLGGIKDMELLKGAMNAIQEILIEDNMCECYNGLVSTAKELLNLMQTAHMEEMGEEAQVMIVRSFATVVAGIPLYSKYLDRELPISQMTRYSLWDSAALIGQMRRENPEIEYEAMRAIEAVKRLKGDRSPLMEYSGRIVHLCQMAGAVYHVQAEDALRHLVQIFDKLPLGTDWFNDSLFFQKVVYLTKQRKESLDVLQTLIKRGIDARNNKEWMYGAIQSLRDTAIRTRDRETQLQVLQGTGQWQIGKKAGGLYELSQFNRYRMKNNWKIRFRAIQAITEIMVLTGDEKIREEIGLYLEKVANNDEDERVKKTAETGHRKYLKIRFETKGKGKKQAKVRQINWEREAEVWGVAEYKGIEPSVPRSAPQSEPAGLDEKKEPESEKWYEGIELEPEYMCPVLRRPLVDAVTLWPSNQRVSEEAATKIMAGNKKCPKTRAEITGYKADAEFRGIVAEKCRQVQAQGKSAPVEDEELAALERAVKERESKLKEAEKQKEEAQKSIQKEKRKQELRKKQVEIAKAEAEARAEAERMKAEAELLAMQAKVKQEEEDLKKEQEKVDKIGVSDKHMQELEALRRKQADLEKSKADMEKKRKEKEAQQAKYLEDQKKLEQAKNEAERRISSMEQESRGQETRIAQLKQEREKMEQARIEAEAQFQRLQKEKEVKAQEAARLERERAVEVRRMQELKEKAERERISLAAAPPATRAAVEEKKVETAGESPIRQLMGGNFFGVQDWGELFGERIQAPPIPANIAGILQSQCPFKKGNNKIYQTHMLFLMPRLIRGKELTIMRWWALEKEHQSQNKGKLLYGEAKDKWYKTEAFANTAVESTQWVLMPKEMVPNSTNKNWSEQLTELQKYPGYEVPNAVSVVSGVLLYYLKTGEKLYGGKYKVDRYLPYVRTSDSASSGNRVDIGRFDADGLSVDDYNGDYRSSNIGLAAWRQ